MKYAAAFSRRAEAAFVRLDDRSRVRVSAAVQALLDEPYARNTKKLKGNTGQRAVRAGQLRIVYFVDQDAATVFVDAIGPRGQVYRYL